MERIITKFESFKENKINENIFSAIGKMFKKSVAYVKKIQGAKKIDNLLFNYKEELLSMVDEEIRLESEMYAKKYSSKVDDDAAKAVEELDTSANKKQLSVIERKKEVLKQKIDAKIDALSKNNELLKEYATLKKLEILDEILKLELEKYKEMGAEGKAKELTKKIKENGELAQQKQKEIEEKLAASRKGKQETEKVIEVNTVYRYFSQTKSRDILVEVTKLIDGNDSKKPYKEQEVMVKSSKTGKEFKVVKSDLLSVQNPKEGMKFLYFDKESDKEVDGTISSPNEKQNQDKKSKSDWIVLFKPQNAEKAIKVRFGDLVPTMAQN